MEIEEQNCGIHEKLLVRWFSLEPVGLRIFDKYILPPTDYLRTFCEQTWVSDFDFLIPTFFFTGGAK